MMLLPTVLLRSGHGAAYTFSSNLERISKIERAAPILQISTHEQPANPTRSKLGAHKDISERKVNESPNRPFPYEAVNARVSRRVNLALQWAALMIQPDSYWLNS